MFKDRLKELRKENGMSQLELAEKIGISQQTVAKWECGVASPKTSTIVILSELFNVSCDYLLGVVPKAGIKEAISILFGGDVDVTEEMMDDVVKFVSFLKQKENN